MYVEDQGWQMINSDKIVIEHFQLLTEILKMSSGSQSRAGHLNCFQEKLDAL